MDTQDIKTRDDAITQLQKRYKDEQHQYKCYIVICICTPILLLTGTIYTFIHNGIHSFASIIVLWGIILVCGACLYAACYFYNCLQTTKRKFKRCQIVLNMMLGKLDNQTTDTRHKSKPADIIPFKPHN